MSRVNEDGGFDVVGSKEEREGGVVDGRGKRKSIP